MAEVFAGALRASVFVSKLLSNVVALREWERRDVLKHFHSKSNQYANDRFGRWWERWALRLMLIDMDLLKQVSDIINTWNDIELLKWDQNLIGSLTAVSVAGSVLASVNVTALSLDGVSDLHWTTRAAFTISLLTAVLSVVFGIRTQRQLYLIGGPTELRHWLSNGRQQDENDAHRFRSSIAATRVLQLPAELLTLSWVTFIAGLILYVSFMWRVHSDPSGVDYRNILICILLVLLVLVGYYEVVGSIKDVEQTEALDPTPALQPPKTKSSQTKHSASTGASTAEANAEGGRYGSALQAAVARGDDEIVYMLLENGADINAEGGQYGSALQAASAEGYEHIVRLLLEKKANVNAKCGRYGSALQAASYRGGQALVELLLENGADVNAQGGEFGNALQAASAGGHVEIVKTLLERGANPNAQGGLDSNALLAAVSTAISLA